jgi:hypothetical protein
MLAGWLKCGGEDGGVPCRPTALDHFVAGGGPSLLWHLVGGAVVLLLLPGAQEGWGARGQGQAKANCGGTTLSASYEAAVSHKEKIEIAVAIMVALSLPCCHCGGCR